MVAKLASLASGIKATDRRVMLRRYRRSFAGRELVSWLQANMGDVPRENAVLMAQQLLRLGVVVPIGDEAAFSDSATRLYCFGAFARVRGRAQAASSTMNSASTAAPNSSSAGTSITAASKASLQREVCGVRKKEKDMLHRGSSEFPGLQNTHRRFPALDASCR